MASLASVATLEYFSSARLKARCTTSLLRFGVQSLSISQTSQEILCNALSVEHLVANQTPLIVAYLCKMAPMATFKHAPFLIISTLDVGRLQFLRKINDEEKKENVSLFLL